MATLPLRRIDARIYGRMVESGALDGEPIELLEGVLCERSPQSPAHSLLVQLLTRHLATANAWLRGQLPLQVSGDSVPESDLALVEDEPSAVQHPTSALLVVEIAVSSHEVDRGVKARLYAAAGAPVYWLIDQPARAIEVRRDPAAGGYGRLDVYRRGATVPSPAAGVDALAVAALFS